MRLIDADKLKIHTYPNLPNIDEVNSFEYVYADDVRNAPTINVDNGKILAYWRTPEKGESIGWICTSCENDIELPLPYCPFCGARMLMNMH